MTLHQKQPEPSYEWVDLPVGPQPLPSWCTGVAAGWADGYGNIPGICLKTNTEAREWADKRFVFEGDCYYRAYSDDGRLEQHAHSGQLSWQDDRQAWVSSRSDGYGGSSWEIMMRPYLRVAREGKKKFNMFDREWTDWRDTYFFQPGRDKVILVGPWHVGAPRGYIEVSYVDTSKPDIYCHRRWHDRTARAGLYITEDLWLRLIARFQPTLRVARTFYGWSGPEGILEPVREDWDEPKHWMLNRQRHSSLSSQQRNSQGE
jgi:hypothetical protein